ncbi:transglutaminase family protein [Georgenia subflava]|uniref:Transglutaminase domain-containing protein n=1 Tax=Georgenia subflava TaxID=1622177 RepID=A0A6N7EFJ9_9MICO|nr:transglutaminase domain-containing protein [Georgenia subflava]MPV37182.1 transglutaminase domain-containing protein [Georgenia subflava]
MIAALKDLLSRRWVDVTVLACLVLVALVPFVPVFGSARLVVAALGGVLLGAALALVGAVRRWGALTMLAAGAVVLVVFSSLGAPTTALGGVVPTPETVGAVGRGVVTSWKEIVTVLPPLGAGGAMLTAPYLLGLVATCTAVTVALRTRRPLWALVPPLLVLPTAILLGTADVTTSVPVGLVVAVAALVWASWRTGRMHDGRWLGVGALVLAGLVAGTGVGVLAPPDGRLVLRERIDPPPDLHDYASPLAGFREYVKDHRDEPVLTVEGLPADAQVRLAVLDAYDGTTWAVSDAATSGSGEFMRIGERIEPQLVDGLHRTTVTVGEYAGVWVPVLGRTYDVDFTGAGAEELARSFYFNRATGTGIATAALGEGDTYQVLAEVPSRPSATQLEGAPLADVALPEAVYPEAASVMAAQLTAEAGTDLARITAIERGLQQGYFSHGLEGETPSLPGHGAARIDELLGGEAMVGDEEQYAAAMALILRSIGIPSRVVMGFEAPAATDGPVELTGDDVTAWVEVPFEGYGWVSYYPTPDEDRIWQEESPVPQNRPQPQVLQPPPPAQEPPDAPPSDRQDVEIDDDEPEEETQLPVAAIVAAAVGGLLLLLLAPLAVIVAVKLRRRKRRRTRGSTSARVAGGWAEVMDVAKDLGLDVSRTATRTQAAEEVVAALALPGTDTRRARRTAPVDASTARATALAQRTDAGTFGPTLPDENHVRGYWTEVESTLGRLQTAVGTRRWWRSRVSTRSLRRAGGRKDGRARTSTRTKAGRGED